MDHDVSTSPAADLVHRLTRAAGRDERLTAPRGAAGPGRDRAPWPAWAAPELVDALRARGIDEPWQHQVDAAEAAHAGEHVVVATGTASGKSLGYLLPALTEIQASRSRTGRRGATALYLSPTKALAQDQLESVLGLGLPGLRGHHARRRLVPRAARLGPRPRRVRPHQPRHAAPLAAARARSAGRGSSGCCATSSIDECHHYRGVFGAHVAQILRRLRRVCASYGASPTFVLASATVAEPEVSASRLTGLGGAGGDRGRLAARRGVARAVGAAVHGDAG